jgi:hypothetical protein
MRYLLHDDPSQMSQRPREVVIEIVMAYIR